MKKLIYQIVISETLIFAGLIGELTIFAVAATRAFEGEIFFKHLWSYLYFTATWVPLAFFCVCFLAGIILLFRFYREAKSEDK